MAAASSARAFWIAPLLVSVLLASACATQAAPQPAFFVEALTEKRVETVPSGPLFWRIEIFAALADAQRAAGPMSLAAEASGRAWLFTLTPERGGSSGGALVAEIGPVPVAPAARYLLRVNRAGGPWGAETPVHTHPGSEAFYVLAGQLSQRTAHGVATLDAGQSMNGHAPGMVMQLTSTGREDLEQLVLFVVDADQPFSSPASFE